MLPALLHDPLRRAATAARVLSRRRSVERVLARPGPPAFYDDDATLAALLGRAGSRGAYRYDPDSLARRGGRRAATVLSLPVRPSGGRLRVVEVGCGDGMAGRALADAGADVTLVDLDDWRDGRAKGVAFHQGDACGRLPLPDGSADVACSFNAFEHLHDPAAALAEMVRVVRPGGLVHLKFGPLYAGAWGLHAYKTLPVPYAQWVFSPGRLASLLGERGISDLGGDRDDLQPMNRWTARQFRDLFASSGGEVVDEGHTPDAGSLWVVGRCPDAFAGRGLTFDDLIVKTLRVTLRKPA